MWWRWTGAVTLGELLGLSASLGLMGAGLALGGEPKSIGSVAIILGFAVLGGLVEGAVLATFQHAVLRRSLPGLPRLPFIAASALTAALCWVLGMTPSLLMSGGEAEAAPTWEPPLFAVLLLAALMGGVLGVVLSSGQALVLARHARGVGWWLVAHAVGWAGGMASIFLILGLVPDGAPTWAFVVGAVIAAPTAGFVVGALTGVFLPRFTIPRTGLDTGALGV
jgi:hypothetical protein